jgi:hypothetical protein
VDSESLGHWRGTGGRFSDRKFEAHPVYGLVTCTRCRGTPGHLGSFLPQFATAL